MVKILANNVNGLNNDIKRRRLFYDLRSKADIICLQETHTTNETAKLFTNEWGGKCFWSHGSASRKGVAILVRKNLNINIINTTHDSEGRAVGISFEHDNETFAIISIYAPNEDNPDFFISIFKMFEELEGKKIIVGDFNLVIDDEIDRTVGSKETHIKASQIVKDYMENAYMSDIWRERHPDSRVYTFTRGKPKFIGSRIDLMITEIALSSWIKTAKIYPRYLTDHAPILIEIKPHETVRGRGYWKLNNSILLEKEYLNLINQELDKLIQNNFSEDAQDIWESIKICCIAHSQNYSKIRASDKRLIISQLEEKIIALNEKSNHTKSENEIIERTTEDLNEIKNETLQGVLFRTKANWYNESEASTKFFFSLEKAKSGAKNMNSILLENGQEVTNINKILNEQHNFYRKLYTKNENVHFDFTNESGIDVGELRESMEGLFTMQEISTAVKGMARNKTPGLDGLPVEFYVMFWNKLKMPLLSAINQAFKNGNLHRSALRGVINLIPKRGKDNRILKHQRPITILCTDYKIVEKVLANRLKPALELIIQEDQKGFLSSRNISCNIRRILDLVTYCDAEDIPGLVISIDFQKCFDMIEIDALLGSMQYFKIGADFQRWTKILFTNAQACIINNGHFSRYFSVTRGVKQGGPCSAYFFLLVAEILAINLKNDPEIKGIMVHNIMRLLGQYADDIDLYLFGEQNTVSAVFRSIEFFSKRTGFWINYDKTTVYRIGAIKNSVAKFYTKQKVKWIENDDSINVLGVEITKNMGMLQKLNFQPLIEKAQGIFQQWLNRGLSLIGKIMIINTLVASLFIYKMTVLPRMSELYINRLHEIINKFIWNNKKPKIPPETLQLPKENGGLGLINFRNKDHALKASWVKLLLTDSMTRIFAENALQPLLQQKIWLCNIAPNDVLCSFKPSFWRDVLESWSLINHKEPQLPEEISSQIIWYNSYIRINDKPIFWSIPYNNDLIELGQIYHATGGLLPCEICCKMFSLTTMQWNSLTSAIPKKWKNILATEISKNTSDYLYNRFILSSKVVQLFNKKLFAEENCYLKCYNRWKKKSYFINIDLDDFCTYFTNVFRVTNQAKLRSFQYRLLHRAIILNDKLKMWKIFDSDLCSFCKEHPENLIHFFWECDITTQIWLQLKNYCKTITKEEECSIDMLNVLFNTVNKKPNHIFNFLTLVCKQYLYASRCLKKTPSFNGLLSTINKLRKYEKYKAVKEDKLTTHLKKWMICKENEVIYNGTNIDTNFATDYLKNLEGTNTN